MARNDYSSYAYYYGSELLKEGYNSAGSQFFIMTTDENVSLTGYYAGFGKVIEGFDILEKVASVKVKKASKEDTEESTPVKDVIITSVKVETFDITYSAPKTHEPFDINSFINSMMSYSMQ